MRHRPDLALTGPGYLEDGVSVIILMNLDDADDETIAVGVAERCLPDRR